MKTRPILFADPMVRALLAGTKTCTRRIVKPQPVASAPKPLKHPAKHSASYFDAYCSEPKTPENPRGMSIEWCWWTADDRPDPLSTIRCPYGAPGDQLWVREAWGLHACGDETDWKRGSVAGSSENDIRLKYALTYRADWGSLQERCFWRPGIHMPRWAARLTLAITGVRVERLHSITESDSWAEGIDACDGMLDEVLICRAAKVMGCGHEDARATYGALWSEINGWDSLVANPFVWAVEFKRVDVQDHARSHVHGRELAQGSPA